MLSIRISTMLSIGMSTCSSAGASSWTTAFTRKRGRGGGGGGSSIDGLRFHDGLRRLDLLDVEDVEEPLARGDLIADLVADEPRHVELRRRGDPLRGEVGRLAALGHSDLGLVFTDVVILGFGHRGLFDRLERRPEGVPIARRRLLFGLGLRLGSSLDAGLALLLEIHRERLSGLVHRLGLGEQLGADEEGRDGLVFGLFGGLLEDAGEHRHAARRLRNCLLDLLDLRHLHGGKEPHLLGLFLGLDGSEPDLHVLLLGSRLDDVPSGTGSDTPASGASASSSASMREEARRRDRRPPPGASGSATATLASSAAVARRALIARASTNGSSEPSPRHPSS